jgi:hypothetical protein
MKIYITILLLLAAVAAFGQTPDSIPAIKRRGGAVKISKDTVPPIAPVVVALPDTSGAGPDSTLVATADSTQKRSNFAVRFIRKDYPNPRKALLFSLIVPGAGQAYNRKWWKIPLVYGVLGGMGYLEYQNIQEFRLYRDSYKALVDEDPNTVVTNPRLILQDRTTMRANREIARKNLEQSSLWLGLAYILSITDAFVDAHLYSFDVSDDLSLKFCPKTQATPGLGLTFGVGIQVGF